MSWDGWARSWIMHYAYESPHKDRRTRVRVHICEKLITKTGRSRQTRSLNFHRHPQETLPLRSPPNGASFTRESTPLAGAVDLRMRIVTMASALIGLERERRRNRSHTLNCMLALKITSRATQDLYDQCRQSRRPTLPFFPPQLLKTLERTPLGKLRTLGIYW